MGAAGAGRAPLRPVPLFSHKAHNDTDDSPLPPPTHSFGAYSDEVSAWDAALPPRSSRANTANGDTCGLCAPWGCEAKVVQVKLNWRDFESPTYRTHSNISIVSRTAQFSSSVSTCLRVSVCLPEPAHILTSYPSESLLDRYSGTGSLCLPKGPKLRSRTTTLRIR